jgi:SAM-dependent methyltransferase
VLEHVADARACLMEIARVLKPGGVAYISVPFLFPTHPDPLDRVRWTLEGLCAAMPEFERIEAGTCGGPFSTLVSIQPTALGSVFSNFALYNAVRFALGWLMWPLKFLDFFAARSSRAYMAAPAFYFLGRKRAAKA